MTEERIERHVEIRMDRLDALLLCGELTQADYDQRTRELNEWAEAQYRIGETI